MSTFRRRSLLYVPADKPRALEKARGLGCDGVIIDLEDSVVPEAKAAARTAAIEALQADWGGREVLVRCNGLDTPWGAADLAAVAAAGPDGALVPKVRTAADVTRCDAALAGAPERTRLWIMLETALGVLNLREIAACAGQTRLEGMVVGLNDLCIELRSQPGEGRANVLPILTQAVLAARAHGLVAIDGVFNDVEDAEGYAAECSQGRALGFDGKTPIHPGQLATCNLAFSSSENEVAWAQAVVAAYALPGNAGKGAIRLQGKLVERLHLAEAERVLRLVTKPEGPVASPHALGSAGQQS